MRAILGVLIGLVLAGPAAAAPLSAWVQVTGRGAEVRAVVEASECPELSVDGRRRPMRERAGPSESFPNRLCVAALPTAARRIAVDGVTLPAPNARPERLLIIGDTGCRIVPGLVQDCNDAVAGWPFAKVAALAARQKPDLVIHVGDYYYREVACPPLTQGCAGSPYGDRWPTWKAELFDPGAPLLKAAPWVFVRGNHEDCRRGGAGWFRLLDAEPQAKTCPAASAPYTVDVGGLRLAILDSAMPDDAKAQPDQVEAFAKDLAAIPKSDTPTWIVTHRPFWALSHHLLAIGGDWGNVNMRAAAQQSGLAGASLILSGHVHNFTSLDFGARRPPQLIVGTGGDYKDPRDLPPPLALIRQVDGIQTRALTSGAFGYFVFDRQGRDWVGAFHDLSDKVIIRCRLHAARLACVPAARKS
ncbi:MAG TPA: metallophosphoesterase [Phenylobacterium sp.]|nr:metallophosphoesterase [Phenylobacterium sp.]